MFSLRTCNCAAVLATFMLFAGDSTLFAQSRYTQLPAYAAPSMVAASSTSSPTRSLLSYRRGQSPEEPQAVSPQQKLPASSQPARVAQSTDAAVNPQTTQHNELASQATSSQRQLPGRRLAPQQSREGGASAGSLGGSKLPFSFPAGKLLSTAGAGLAIVVGLFLACMWLLRGKAGGTPRGGIPKEAFAVLGRAPLFGRTTAQLMRLGNKLVLVAVSPEGLQPLVEVTDPAEVDRIAGLCLGSSAGSSNAEFQQVLRQLAQEPATGFLGGEAA